MTYSYLNPDIDRPPLGDLTDDDGFAADLAVLRDMADRILCYPRSHVAATITTDETTTLDLIWQQAATDGT